MIVLGIMSGTSLDGLDLVFAQFDLTPETKQQYQWKIIKGKTIDYNLAFKDKLSKAVNLSGFELMQLHADFGVYLGKCCKDFIDESKVIPDLIASHGHTVFHEVKKGFTTQIGDGHKIAAITGVNTIFDFRSLNVAYGGQGAPLVPIGDEFLFSEYDSCLNLGGIANISYKLKNKRLAFDICPFNLLLNKFALQNGYAYDAGGKMAKSGKVCSSLLLKLREIPYYKQTGAKSLDKEQLLHYYNQLFNGFNLSVVDFLSTLVEHFTEEIATHLNGKNCLVTGGGAFNTYFIERLKQATSSDIVVPSADIVNYKEALIFAFMGFLRCKKQINSLSSATGAKTDLSSGAMVIVPSNESLY